MALLKDPPRGIPAGFLEAVASGVLERLPVPDRFFVARLEAGEIESVRDALERSGRIEYAAVIEEIWKRLRGSHVLRIVK